MLPSPRNILVCVCVCPALGLNMALAQAVTRSNTHRGENPRPTAFAMLLSDEHA